MDRQGRVYALAEVSFAREVAGGEIASSISSGLYWWVQYYSETLLRRLMSLGTVGSIAVEREVERSAKTAENDVLMKQRNTLTDAHAETNTRGHINIKLMLKPLC